MQHIRSLLYPVLLLFVSLWLALIVLAPYGLERHWGGASLIYFAFHLVCHQLPERSFFWSSAPLAVCHRCLGLYLGFWLGLLALPWLAGVQTALLRRPRRLLLFWLPLCFDLLWTNVAWSRFLTGIWASLPLGVFLVQALHQLSGPFHAGPRTRSGP